MTSDAADWNRFVLDDSWVYQWGRVERLLDGVRNVYAGMAGGTVAAVDIVQGFFESIHHLKDWLKNDPKVAIGNLAIEDFVTNNIELRLCADLANASKHLTLNQSHTGDIGTGIKRNDVTVKMGTGAAEHHFYIESNGVEHDVLDVAEAAVTQWEGFLTGKGLLKPGAAI